MKEIALLVGSLRKNSINRKIAKELIRIAPESLSMEIVEIGNLNLYDEDLEENPPEAWKTFRSALKSSDGIFFMSPEYNRSIPGVLKNAIDVASRPPKDNVLKKKPAAVATASRSGIAGVLANHAIRQAIVFSQVRMLPTEIYLGQTDELFKADRATLKESTEDFLKGVLSEFNEWVTLFS